MNKILLLLVLHSFNSFSQTNISWGPEITVADGSIYGYTRPRISLTADGIPIVLWGKAPNGALYTARFNGTSFETPVGLLPPNVDTYLASWTGPDIASKGDTVIAVFKAMPLESGHVLSVRSTDGGITWSDTIRTDSHNNGGVAWMPSLDMDELGNPSVVYMTHDPLWSIPRYVVTHSADQGQTYQAEMNVAAGIADEACDCCPAEYVIDGTDHALLFRNNASNIRDSYAVYSADDGLTYNETENVDQLNWTITSCPSTGPHGLFNNGKLWSVFASRASGSYRVYLSETATAPTLAFESRTMMTAPMNVNGSQNFPRISGTNDTIVMVWQESETSNYEIFSAITTSANNSELISSKAIVNTLTTGMQTNPDIAFLNGKAHVVYQDANSGDVIYRQGTVSMAGLNELSHKMIDLYPNPSENGKFYLNEVPDQIEHLSVTDLSGKDVQVNISEEVGRTIIALPQGQKGYYILKVQFQGSIYTTELFVL